MNVSISVIAMITVIIIFTRAVINVITKLFVDFSDDEIVWWHVSEYLKPVVCELGFTDHSEYNNEIIS